ncbi:ShlB/FhaC/HecB family hemolysin secretion/activation protein [Oleidesulfovibrio alaskensis]
MVRVLLQVAAMALSLGVLGVFSGVDAASAVTPDEAVRQQQILQQREEQRRLELERRHKESLQKPPSGQNLDLLQKEAVPDEGQCFEVRQVVLEGATLLSDDEKSEVITPYLYRCLCIQDINNLVRDITNKYIEKGYITTRIAVPQQNLGGGILTLLVIEGRVESIKFDKAEKDAKRKLKMAFPDVEGHYLNIRDIEQGLDQLNRLPSNNAKADFVPGSTTGSTRVVIDNQREKSWRSTIGLDNSGQESTGELQYSLALDKDNPLGINDLLSVSYNADYESMVAGEHQDSQSIFGFYSFGYGYWAFTGSISRFDYRTKVQGASTDFTSSGNTVTTSVSADYTFHRDADSTSSLGTGLTVRDTSNYLAGVKLKASSQILSVAHVSATHSRRMFGGALTFNGKYSRGVPIWGAAPDPNNLNISDPKAEFDKVSMMVDYYRPFQLLGTNLSWSSRLWGQWSPDSLYSAEQASIGSRYSVRGFHEDSLSGDTGGYIRNELALILPAGAQGSLPGNLLGNVQLYAGYDAGFIKEDQYDPYERGTVQGAALGIRTFGGTVMLDIMAAKPLDSPDYVQRDDWDFYASLKVTF